MDSLNRIQKMSLDKVLSNLDDLDFFKCMCDKKFFRMILSDLICVILAKLEAENNRNMCKIATYRQNRSFVLYKGCLYNTFEEGW